MTDTTTVQPRQRAMALLFRLALILALGLSLAWPAARAGAQPADTDDTLASIRQQIDGLQKSLTGSPGDAQLLQLRQSALAAQTQAADIAASLDPQLGGLKARLAELGPPTPGAKEDPDLARQRAQLDSSRNALDAQIKLARLLAVEGEQLAAQTWVLRRSQFQAHLGERTTSILSVPFWSELDDDAPRDAARLAALGRELRVAAGSARWWVWVLVVLLGAGVWPLRAAVDSRARRLIATRLPSGRLRRSVYALLVVLLWTLSFGVLAELLRGALVSPRTLSPSTDALLDSVAGMLWVGGNLTGLLNALLCADRPSWRLAPIPDAVAEPLRRAPLVLAIVSILTRVAERLAVVINASLALTVAVNCFVALALALTVGLGLTRAERLWRIELSREGAQQRPLWRKVIATAGWLVLIGSFASVLVGYVAFGSFAVKQLVWMFIVASSCYLLASLVDDACMTWLASPPVDDPVHGTGGSSGDKPAVVASRGRDQAAVLLSGLLRLVLALVALMLVLLPFGEGPGDLLRRTNEWQGSLAIGEVQIRPAALLQAVLVLVLGLFALKVLRAWLVEQYLPTTSLDPGMRVSANTLFGYAGVIVAVSLALSAVGIGLERVAWVASALSVGIGFGLQAVVQNFVSGLILLAERPVKVGDWVSLGGVEGDIRRINVRATEIQMGDRSTVIVPNSEFITKVVRNVTWSDPLGLVQVKLPVPLGSNVEQVRDLMLAAFEANVDVLATPEPNVLLDGIENGFLQFNATGFVDSPRLAGGVRSALLFDVLRRLDGAGITLIRPPTMLLGSPAAPLAAPPAGGIAAPVPLPAAP